MIIKGFARICKETEFSFGYSIFIYPLEEMAIGKECEDGSELIGIFPIEMELKEGKIFSPLLVENTTNVVEITSLCL